MGEGQMLILLLGLAASVILSISPGCFRERERRDRRGKL